MISHALDCKRGGLVTARHNELRDGVADLAGKDFTPSHVRDDPLIYQGCAVKRTKANPDGPSDTTDPDDTRPEAMEQKGDLLVETLGDPYHKQVPLPSIPAYRAREATI